MKKLNAANKLAKTVRAYNLGPNHNASGYNMMLNALEEYEETTEPSRADWTKQAAEELVACFDCLYDSNRREEIEETFAKIISKYAP